MFQKIKETIEGGRRFLVTTHKDPDGDALGSAFAMAFALIGLAKDAVVYLKDPVPYRYRFLPKPPTLLHEISGDDGYDGVIVLDCGSLFRVGNGFDPLRTGGVLINVDHHVANDAFGQINILDERASSAAEILYLILQSLGVRFTFEIAVNLYTAILTDTGSFRYESTTKRAFSICEEMTAYGVVPAAVAGEVYENHPRERYDLLCLVLSTLETFLKDRLAVATVTREMFVKTGTNREHTEGFVEQIKEIGSVRVACLMRELDDRKYKLSMRSKGDVDVAAVARTFGGGGHRNAAGCVMDGDAKTVKNELVGAFSL